MAIPVRSRIRRYQAWLNREPMLRPLIGLLWEVDIRPLPEFIDSVGQGTPITWEQIRPEFFLPYVETWHRRERQLTTDSIHSFRPAFGIPWAEAILGCPIVAGEGSIWAKPKWESYAERPAIEFDPSNPWLKKLLQFTQALVELSRGRFPVALPPIHSPLDILGAMCGEDRMLLDLIERPMAVQEMLCELTQFYLLLQRAILDLIPPFHGGYATRLGMWAPGKAITPQNEYASMISPEMYAEFALPIDRTILAHFPYHSFHLHGSAQHQIDLLLGLKKLSAIQITLEHDVGGPSLERMLTLARRILQVKPLLLVSPDIQTAEICLQELPSTGLCLLLMEGDADIKPEKRAWLRAECASSPGMEDRSPR